MKELIVNGRFSATAEGGGIHRFSLQILKEFAKRKDLHVIFAMPKNGIQPPIESDNLEYVKIGGDAGTKWEQFTLPRFCKRKKLPLLSMGNAAPLFIRANVVLHDMYSFDFDPETFHEDWMNTARKMIKGFVNHNQNLFTVSEFSKNRILAHYPKMKRPPIVIPNGHEHVYEWREEPVEGLPEKFFLSVSSVSPHKNFSYILSLAEHNPQSFFLVSGGGGLYEKYKSELKEKGVENCSFAGRLSDGQLLWLYRHAEGLIMPSLYEGFGLPPLEAVACGCRRIYLSDIPVFREIYGDCAVFFDPKDYEKTVSLNSEPMSEETAQKLLEKYSWKRTAEIILSSIFPKGEV